MVLWSIRWRYVLTMVTFVGTYLGVSSVTACKTKSLSSVEAIVASGPHIILQFGTDVDQTLRQRVPQLIQAAGSTLEIIPDTELAPTKVPDDALILALGDTRLTRTLIDQESFTATASEGFIVKSAKSGSTLLIAGRGKPAASDNLPHGNIGNSYAAYAILEQLGFAFLRPLAPTIPSRLHSPSTDLAIREQPHWRIRAMHLHTQHPLELTNFLQGWGAKGPDDKSGWEAMQRDWDLYLEWLIANRQNRVEWALLWAKSWQSFADSDERLARLKYIVERGQAFGVGVDVPLTLAQQHAYRLIRQQGALDTKLAQLRASVDWFMRAGFDFLGTETGNSEFTHPTAESTLAWMNELAQYTWDHYGKPSYIKIHCSTGQVAKNYKDPQTGQPINFNMLPHYAHPRMGVLPHTVQHYGLDDPAPTYGNETFAYMRDFLKQEVGRREVVWYPETA